eukprot:m.206321 g.206321  ORF g.206321 m.206321 type:complete len:401 (-) comp15536_c8_seq1:104-1306(-)
MSGRTTSHDPGRVFRKTEPEPPPPATMASAKTRSQPKETVSAPAVHFSSTPMPIISSPPDRIVNTRFFCEFLYFFHFSLLLLIQHFHLNELNFYRYNTAFILLATSLLFRRVAWLYFRSLLLFKMRDLLRPRVLFLIGQLWGYLSWVLFGLGSLLVSHSIGDVIAVFYPYLLYLCLFGLSSNLIERARLIPVSSPFKAHAVVISLKYIVCKCFFYSFEATYLTAVLPLRFQKNDHVLYESFDLLSFVVFAVLNALVIAVLELYACQHKTLLANANAVGEWTLLNRSTGGTIWSPNTTYSKGAVVRYKKKVYQALYNPTSAPPNRLWVFLLNYFSRVPQSILTALLAVQAIVVVVTIIAVLLSPRWHISTAWGLFALSNYALLWQICLVRRALSTRKAKKK